MARVLDRLRADRVARFSVGLSLAVVVASTVWFFTARDDRGRTARLTADAWYYHAYLPTLLYDGDLDFTDQYRVTHNWYRFGNAPNGKPANVFGVGPALFQVPFFALGADITRASGGRADGFSRPEVELSLLASLVFSLGALGFVAATIRRRFDAPYLAALVPLVLACAGPVVYYAIRQPGYAHPFATFFAAALIDRWDRSYDREGPRSLGTWLVLGGLLGAAALARMQLALWAIVLVPAVVDDLRRHRADGRDWGAALRAQLPRWAAGAALCMLLVLPQLIVWKVMYGAWVVTPQGEGFMRWDAPAWSEVLFSSRNGLLPWAPLYAVAALGLVVCALRRPRLGVPILIGIALQTVANGAAWDWWAGGSFGGRRFDSCFAGFALGLAALVAWPAPRAAWRGYARRAGVGAVLALSLVLAIGNLEWAARVSAPTARIEGAQAAHVVLRKRIGGPVGAVVAAASRASNWPARAWFASAYDTDVDAYDFVVGHHTLGELFPGLNSFRGKAHERLPLVAVRRKLGGVTIDAGGVRVRDDRAQILIGFNRFGPVTLGLELEVPAGQPAGDVVMRFNGREIARALAAPGKPVVLRGSAAEVERGTNRVEILAPPGTRLSWLDVRGPVDPRRKR